MGLDEAAKGQQASWPVQLQVVWATLRYSHIPWSLTVRQQFTVRVGRLDSGYMGGRSNTSAKSEIAYIFSYFYSTTDVAFILG